MPEAITMQSTAPDARFNVRRPIVEDAAEMWRLANRAGLDVNSEYSYMMVCHFFASTSAVAKANDSVVGFVSGFRTLESPSELFIWQIAVSPEMRGCGVAGRMLDELVTRLRPTGLQYVQATINPSNEASIRTFTSLAGRLECEFNKSVLFHAEQFSGESHEEEVLYRIGPF